MWVCSGSMGAWAYTRDMHVKKGAWGEQVREGVQEVQRRSEKMSRWVA